MLLKSFSRYHTWFARSKPGKRNGRGRRAHILGTYVDRNGRELYTSFGQVEVSGSVLPATKCRGLAAVRNWFEWTYSGEGMTDGPEGVQGLTAMGHPEMMGRVAVFSGACCTSRHFRRLSLAASS